MKNFIARKKSLRKIGMDRIFAFLIFSLCLLFSFTMSAQDKALQLVNTYLKENQARLGLEKTDVEELVITDTYQDQHNGVTHIYLKQKFNGIEINNTSMGLHYSQNNELIHATNRLQKKLSARLNKTKARITAAEALQSAAAHLGIALKTQPGVLEQKSNKAQETLFAKSDISLHDIPAKLVYQVAEDGSLKLSWQVDIYTTDAQHYWQVLVDAAEGKVIRKNDLVISCDFECHEAGHDHEEDGGSAEAEEVYPAETGEKSMSSGGNFYRVYDAPVETPNHGGRSLVFTDGDPTASPYGWHYDGSVQYMVTRGNNVYAYEDHSGGNAGAPAVGGVLPNQPLNFDFPLDLSQDPHSYTDAAITNLFYWNNVIHDVMYHYGFTEPAGNFQTDNLGKGGIGNDAVMAEAQDGGGTNNANFLTLPDGAPGRMQMYLWSSNAPADLVHIESSTTYASGGISFNAIQAAFGPDITETGVSGELVIVEANVNSLSSCNSCGCGTGQGAPLPPNNDVAGKIVLIDRGDCTFIEKVNGAQIGGAVGVIVVNNIPGAGPIAMGGDETGNAITIPSAMISYEDGLELKDEIALGNITVSLKRLDPIPPLKDGDLDNGIIVHEYGHGISTRLTGGPTSTCLGGDEQAGEGWSDYFALMMTMDAATVADGGYAGRGIGTYVFDEPTSGTGIRPARYSRDFAVNDYTYAGINRPEITVPHGVGFVFCTALWEMTWNLIDVYGYDPDIYSANLNAGNTLALQLVIDGLKLQPCSPTFIESRDAILAADLALTGGANQCLIWKAFAKRGMGYSAVSGTNDRGDEMEAFDLPPSCLPDLVMTKTASHLQASNGDVITYTLSVSNVGAETAIGVLVTDPIPANSSFVTGSASHGGSEATGIVSFPAFDVNAGQTVDLTFDVTVNALTATSVIFGDNMEDGINAWDASLGVNMWTIQNEQSFSGDFAWFAADPDNLSEQLLTIANAVNVAPGSELRFWHKYDTEAGFDGGKVEISPDGGTIWYDLGGQMTQNGYTDFIPAANNPSINGFAFGGSSNGWKETVVDLSIFAGQNVLIRFRFSSDVATPGQGWWVDDVLIGTNPTFVINTASFVSLEGQSGEATASTIVVEDTGNSVLTQPSAGQNRTVLLDQENNPLTPGFTVVAFPNPARDVLNLRLDGFTGVEANIYISNLQGQILKTQQTIVEGSRFMELNIADIPTGLYLLQVQDDLHTQTLKISIQR